MKSFDFLVCLRSHWGRFHRLPFGPQLTLRGRSNRPHGSANF